MRGLSSENVLHETGQRHMNHFQRLALCLREISIEYCVSCTPQEICLQQWNGVSSHALLVVWKYSDSLSLLILFPTYNMISESPSDVCPIEKFV